MMSLMRYADQYKEDKKYCCAWLPEGKSFVIRNPDEFSRHIVPLFFKPTKFSSFTRKLYRWGFRQINRGIGPDDPIIFGNEFFDRDNAELMARMRSITAAGARKAEQNNGRHGNSGAGAMMMMGMGGPGGMGGMGGVLGGPGSGGVGKRSYFEAGGGMYEQGGPDQKRLFDHYLNQKAGHLMTPGGMPFYGAATMGSNGGPMSIGNIPMRPSMGGGGGGGGVPMGGGAIGFVGGLDGSGHGSFSGATMHPQQYMSSSHQQMMGGYNAAGVPTPMHPSQQKTYDMMQQQQSQMPQMQALPQGMGGMSQGQGQGAYGMQQQMAMQQQMQQQYQMQMQMQMQQQQQQMQMQQQQQQQQAEHGSGEHGMGGNGVNMDSMCQNGGMHMMGRHGGGSMGHGMMNNHQHQPHHGMNRMNTPSPTPPMMAGGGGGASGGSGGSVGGGTANNNNAVNNNSPYPGNPQSTQEIVNAAIAALRYAN
jgi:hypothetical protein